MLQEADIVGHAVAALCNRGQAVQNPAVHLTRIGLSADVKARLKAKVSRDHAVHLVNLRLVALEQLHEAGLRARRAAAAEEPDVLQRKVDLVQIGEEILHPQRRALADGHQLRRLIVRVSERRQRFVRLGEVRQIGDDLEQLTAQIAQTVAIEDQVGVVRHIAARRAQMDDARCGRRRLAIGIDVRHHVVADLLLAPADAVVIDVVDVRFKLRNLIIRDRQAQRGFSPGQRDPQPAPGAIARVRGEQLQHVAGRIARGQGRFVSVGAHLCACFLRMMLSLSGPTET